MCDILKAFPNEDGKTLDQPYDIRQMLSVLELEGWHDEPAYKFYFTDLEMAYKRLVAELRRMHKNGTLRCSYYVEKNKAMTEFIIDMVRCDVVVQQLAADALKRDQFKEIYEVHRIVYESALKDTYLDGKKNKAVMEDVIPQLTAFRQMLHIRDNHDRMQADREAEEKRKAERLALGIDEEEEDEKFEQMVEKELALLVPPTTKKTSKKKVEIDPEIIEEARRNAAYKRELEIYGVSTRLPSLRPSARTDRSCGVSAHVDLGDVLRGSAAEEGGVACGRGCPAAH